jgi:hypothetical protein
MACACYLRLYPWTIGLVLNLISPMCDGKVCLIIVWDLIIYVYYLPCLILCMDNLAYLLTCLYHVYFLIYWKSFLYPIHVAHCIQTQIQPCANIIGELLQYAWKHLLYAYHNILWTLARFVIVNQKGGDCKGISPLTFILIYDDTRAVTN